MRPCNIHSGRTYHCHGKGALWRRVIEVVRDPVTPRVRFIDVRYRRCYEIQEASLKEFAAWAAGECMDQRPRMTLTCANCRTTLHNVHSRVICPTCGQQELCEYLPTPEEIRRLAARIREKHYAMRRSEVWEPWGMDGVGESVELQGPQAECA